MEGRANIVGGIITARMRKRYRIMMILWEFEISNDRNNRIRKSGEDDSNEWIDEHIPSFLEFLFFARWEDHLDTTPRHTDHAEYGCNSDPISDSVREDLYPTRSWREKIRINRGYKIVGESLNLKEETTYEKKGFYHEENGKITDS